MMCPKRHVTRSLALAVVALSSVLCPTRATSSAGIDSPAASVGPAPDLGPSAAIRPEVRLRKLHLVRPDLIPYPIASEIYC